MSVSRHVEKISFKQKLKIYFFAVVYTFWILAKRVPKLCWRRGSNSKNAAKEKASLSLLDLNFGKQSFIKIKGVKLHYIEVGEKTAPPLLLLHGFPDCWLGWKNQLSILATEYHVFAIDLKGFGDSDKPSIRIHYGLPQLIIELRQLLISLTEDSKFRTVTLVGHDLGGLLGWFLVHDSPELIEKYVAVSAPHPNVFWNTLSKSGPLNYEWMYHTQIPWFPEFEMLKDDLSIITSCCPHLSNKSDLLDTYRYVFSRHEDWTGPLNYYRNLIFWRVRENCDMINVPILLIHGNDDPQVPLESVVRSMEWCNNAILKIVDKVGHFPHQEAPEKFNTHLMKFLIIEKQTNLNGKNKEVVDAGVMKVGKDLVGRLFGAVHIF